MSQVQEQLAARVRAILGADVPVREVAMFGGRAIMVDGKVVVGAEKDGALLVRVDDARHDELTARPGAEQARMGGGRPMGPGWLHVAADAIDADDELAFWVGVAMDHNRAAR